MTQAAEAHSPSVETSLSRGALLQYEGTLVKFLHGGDLRATWWATIYVTPHLPYGHPYSGKSSIMLITYSYIRAWTPRWSPRVMCRIHLGSHVEVPNSQIKIWLASSLVKCPPASPAETCLSRGNMDRTVVDKRRVLEFCHFVGIGSPQPSPPQAQKISPLGPKEGSNTLLWVREDPIWTAGQKAWHSGFSV